MRPAVRPWRVPRPGYGRKSLSVIVTVVDGGDALRRCLLALMRQRLAPPMDIVVPYDASISATVMALRPEFPGVRFLGLGRIDTERPLHSAAGQHELFDRRRAAGLAAARGDLVAMLEDRGAPGPDWAT